MKMIKTMYLALSLALISSCAQEKEIKREDYKSKFGIIHYDNPPIRAVTIDYTDDGRIDMIQQNIFRGCARDIVALDSALIENEKFYEEYGRHINKTIPLTKEMSDLATKITELQRELNFKIDSTYNARNFLPSTQHK